MVWRTCLGICCRDTGKVEFWEVLNDTWKEVVARVASSWNSNLQTDAAVNIHLNLQLSCEQFKTNCYLRCTQSDPMNVCPSPPFWWLGLSWIFMGSALCLATRPHWLPAVGAPRAWAAAIFEAVREQGLDVAEGESARLFFSVIYFYFYLWSQFLPSMKSWDREPYPWRRWKMMQCWHSLCLLVFPCPTFNSDGGVTVPGVCRNIHFI